MFLFLQTAPKIFGGELKTHLLSFFSGDNEEFLANLREVAADFKGKVHADGWRDGG